MRFIHFLLLAFLVALLVACTDSVETNPAPRADDALDDRRFAALDQALEQERSVLGAPGVTAAVVQDGHLVWRRAYGVRGPHDDTPTLPSTLFRIGSLTKQMTAVAVLQLVDAGLVDLAAPVTDYVPSFHLAGDPKWASSIRVEDLLVHTSSMRDYMVGDWYPRDDGQLSAYLTGEQFAEAVYLMAAPGRMWNYSNPNYMVAGLLAESVRSTPYRDVMAARVFGPLAMNRTYFLPSEVLADGDYASCAWINGTTAGPDRFDNPWARPAAFAWSSVLDLARWTQFLLQGNPSVLSDATRARMMSPLVDTETRLDLNAYGYGVFVQRGFSLDGAWYELPVVSHDGAVSGYTSSITMVPSQGFALVILANAAGAQFDDSVATALKTLVALPEPTALPDMDMRPEDLWDYVGSYQDDFTMGLMRVTTDGAGLFIEIPGLEAERYQREMKCSVRDNCVLDAHGWSQLATFVRDGQGRVEFLRTRRFVGRRVVKEAGAAGQVTRGAAPSRAARPGGDDAMTPGEPIPWALRGVVHAATW